jgi:WD40 repeat protein
VKAIDFSPFANINDKKLFKGHRRYIYSLVISPTGLLFSGSGDSTIKVWNTKDGKCINTLESHKGSVMALALYDKTLYSGSRDRTIKVWDLDSYHCTRTLTGHRGDVLSLAVSKNRLYSSGANCTIRIWDREKLICIHIIYNHNKITRTLLTIDNRLLTSCGAVVQIWDDVTQNEKEPNSSALLAESNQYSHSKITNFIS